MIINKPKFWDKKIGLISILLIPLTIFFIFLLTIRKTLIKERKFKIPIICVGNIYIGGTGKTPLSILLADELSKLGKKTAILRKYYKEHDDEYNLIKNSYQYLIIDKNRSQGIRNAEKKEFKSIILDDGLQDYKIKKDVKIVCFNSRQLIGNGLVFPSGPLRESLKTLKDVNLVIINGTKDLGFEKKILNINNKLEIFYSSYKPINLSEFRNKKLFAIAGIGNPENFFNLIENYELEIEKKLEFPDHYQFSKKEIVDIIQEAEKNNLQVIMTEKDYFKIKKFNLNKIRYLKISLEIKNKSILINKLDKLYD